jgi:phosphomannomutase
VFQASVPYLAGLWKRFHALRPLQVAIGCPVRFVRRTIEHLFESLPVTLRWVEIPQRRRDLLDDDDVDVSRMRQSVCAEPCDFGVLIDDDGANLALFDEQGERLSPEDALCLVAAPLLAEHPQGAVAIENSARNCLQPRLIEMNARCWLGGWTQSDMWPTMRHAQAVLGPVDLSAFSSR